MELYDVVNDPNETTNMAVDKELMSQLSTRLEKGWEDALPN